MTTQHAPAATVRTLGTLDIFVRSNTGEVALDHVGRRRLVGLEDGARRRRLRARRRRGHVRRACGCSPAAAARWSTTSTTRGTGPQNGWDGWKLLHPPPPRPRRRPCDLAAGRLTGAREARRASASGRGWPAARGGPTARRSCRRRSPPRPRRAAGPRTATADRQRLLHDAAPGRPDPAAQRAGARARRRLARVHDRARPHPRRRDAEGHQAASGRAAACASAGG